MLLIASNDKEAGCWAWRIVFASNFIGSIVTIMFAIDEHLTDMFMLHQINTTLQLLWWFFFTMCLFKSPGIVVDDLRESGKYSYETCLELIGQGIIDDSINLCHTCRVRRPLRSKHCRILNRCVYKFDHFWLVSTIPLSVA